MNYTLQDLMNGAEPKGGDTFCGLTVSEFIEVKPDPVVEAVDRLEWYRTSLLHEHVQEARRLLKEQFDSIADEFSNGFNYKRYTQDTVYELLASAVKHNKYLQAWQDIYVARAIDALNTGRGLNGSEQNIMKGVLIIEKTHLLAPFMEKNIQQLLKYRRARGLATFVLE